MGSMPLPPGMKPASPPAMKLPPGFTLVQPENQGEITTREHLRDQGFLDSAWESLKAPFALMSTVFSPGEYAKAKQGEIDEYKRLAKSGTPEQKREFAKDYLLRTVPGLSTLYKASHGNIGGAVGDVAGMAPYALAGKVMAGRTPPGEPPPPAPPAAPGAGLPPINPLAKFLIRRVPGGKVATDLYEALGGGRRPAPPPSAPPVSAAAAAEAETLEGLAQSLSRKSYANMTADEQASIRNIAAKLEQPRPPMGPPTPAPPAPQGPPAKSVQLAQKLAQEMKQSGTAAAEQVQRSAPVAEEIANRAAMAKRFAEKFREGGIDVDSIKKIRAGYASQKQMQAGEPPRWGNVAEFLGENEPSMHTVGEIIRELNRIK